MQLGKAGLGLSVLALLLVGASPVFAGDPGGPGAPNNATNSSISVSGTWTDAKLVFSSQSIVATTDSITTEICGTITGGLHGTYCDYRNLVVDLVTGQGSFSALDICSCNPKTTTRPAIISNEIGTVTITPVGTDILSYQAIIQRTFGSSVTNGTLNFNGVGIEFSFLASGTYSGTIN